MGEPPPISLYFSMMDGVRLLAIRGPSHDWEKLLAQPQFEQSKQDLVEIIFGDSL